VSRHSAAVAVAPGQLPLDGRSATHTGGARHERRAPAEKTLAQYLGVAVSAAVLVIVVALAALVIVLPLIVGGNALTVLTSSMAPKYPAGTLIVTKPTPIDEIKVGDVLTYQIASGSPAVISHRVITRTISTDGETTFTTKGDNNSDADPEPVREVQVKGTLWYAIPQLGWVNNALSGESRGVLVPVAAGGLFAYAAYLFASTALARWKRRRIRE
jgi:signal peptidase